MTASLASRYLPAIVLALGLSACASRAPVNPPILVAAPNQCVVRSSVGEVRPLGPVPYEVLERQCGAEAWCAGWEFPQNHSLVYAQTFRQCVARGLGASSVITTVQPVAPVPSSVLAPAAPPARPALPPRPYRN